MSSATRMRRRLMAALKCAGVLAPAAVGCAAAVNPSGDGGADIILRDTPPGTDAVSATDAVTVADVVTPLTDVVIPAACTGTVRPVRECMTIAQVEDRIRNPPGDIVRDSGVDAGPITVPREPNGCYAPSGVQSGCCNPAVAVARVGEQCCYLWCEQACCGRPLLVEGHARVATRVASGDWCGAECVVGARLDDVTRAALAAAWRTDAFFEHASIASFARFTLDLLALGAPPELLADAQRAAADEVEHARLCFSLAAALDVRRDGPGSINLIGVGATTSLADAVGRAVEEGCVGETYAAMLARAQLEEATDSHARAALERIASDETAHAELAWRFVAWGVRVGGAPVRVAADEAFARALARSVHTPGPTNVDPRAWHAFGRLDAHEAQRVLETARDEVVRPCADALLDAQFAPSQTPLALAQPATTA